MSAIASTPTDAAAKNALTSGRLFFLDLRGGRILSQTLMAPISRPSSTKAGNCPMAWCSMSLLGTSTGPIWAIPRGMMARSCGRISMART